MVEFFSYSRRKKYFLLGFVIIAMVIVTTYFKCRVLPWEDEVAFLDTALTYLKTGEWIGYSWNDCGLDSKHPDLFPFQNYQPLYLWLTTCWHWLLGTSIISLRLFNVTIVGIVSYLISIFFANEYTLSKVNTILISIVSFLTFSMLLSLTGRPDALNLLTCILFLKFLYNYIIYGRKVILVSLASALTMLAGIPAAILIFLVTLFLIIIFSGYRKKLYKAALYMIVGLLVGELITFAYFFVVGYEWTYFVSLISYSATVKALAVKMLPLVGPLLGIDVDSYLARAADDVAGPSLIERIFGAYSLNIEYIILVILALFGVLYNYINQRKFKGVWVVVLAAIFPLLMSFIGRYVIYYTWMGCLIALLGFIFIFSQIVSKYKPLILLLLISVFLCVGAYANIIKTDDSDRINELSQVAHNMNLSEEDAICISWDAYYAFKKYTSKTYTLGNYPFKYIREEISYLVIPTNHINDRHYIRQKREFDSYINFLNENKTTVKKEEEYSSEHYDVYRVIK